MSRRAFTLVELLVVLGIIAVLLGLLLPAVQKVRSAASRAYSSNDLRQMGIAIHNYNEGNNSLPLNGILSTHMKMLPWLEHGNYYDDLIAGRIQSSDYYEMKPFLCPTDPTLTTPDIRKGVASYTYNALVFVPTVRRRYTIENTLLDGTSNTVLLATHYAFGCEGRQFSWFSGGPEWSATVGGRVLTMRRASFADTGDVVPSVANPPTLTFQVRPRIGDCNPRIPQTPFEGGLLVGMGDGSVRTVNPNVSAATFWSAVTPAGGEVLGADW